MDRLEDIITAKYYWNQDIKIKLAWANKALEEGIDTTEIVEYINREIYSEAA